METYADSLVAAKYPEAWAKADSRRRNKLRKRFREEHAMSMLRADGAQCRNCQHYAGFMCRAHSTTFGGTCNPAPDYLCLDWKARP